jgi:hypothetical protein
VTSTPSKISNTCRPPAAEKKGGANHSNSMRVSAMTAMEALMAKCIAEALKRVIVEVSDVNGKKI